MCVRPFGDLVVGRIYLLKTIGDANDAVELEAFMRSAPEGASFCPSLFCRLCPHVSDVQDGRTIELLKGSTVDPDALPDGGVAWDAASMDLRRALFKKREIGGL